MGDQTPAMLYTAAQVRALLRSAVELARDMPEADVGTVVEAAMRDARGTATVPQKGISLEELRHICRWVADDYNPAYREHVEAAVDGVYLKAEAVAAGLIDALPEDLVARLQGDRIRPAVRFVQQLGHAACGVAPVVPIDTSEPRVQAELAALDLDPNSGWVLLPRWATDYLCDSGRLSEELYGLIRRAYAAALESGEGAGRETG